MRKKLNSSGDPEKLFEFNLSNEDQAIEFAQVKFLAWNDEPEHSKKYSHRKTQNCCRKERQNRTNSDRSDRSALLNLYESYTRAALFQRNQSLFSPIRATFPNRVVPKSLD